MSEENKPNYSKQQNFCLKIARQERERVKRIKIALVDHLWFHVGDNKQVQCDVGPTKDV